MIELNLRVLLIAGLLTFAAVAVPSGKEWPSDLPGRYDCRGTADGKAYESVVEISKVGSAFYLRWIFPEREGRQSFMLGVGFVENGRLVVGFAAPNPGVIVYRVQKATPFTLAGTWTGYGADRTYAETLTKTGPLERPAPAAPDPSRLRVSSGA